MRRKMFSHTTSKDAATSQIEENGRSNQVFTDKSHSLTDIINAEEIVKLCHLDQNHSTSPIEEKFRAQLDTLLKENLNFRLRFSTFDNIFLTCWNDNLVLLNFGLQRSSVFVGPFNDKRFTSGGDIKQEAKVPKFHGLQMTDNENEVFPISNSENLCLGENLDSSSVMFLPFESLVNVFEIMRKIVLRNVEDIRLEGLSIMSLIMVESKPNSVREKSGEGSDG